MISRAFLLPFASLALAAAPATAQEQPASTPAPTEAPAPAPADAAPPQAEAPSPAPAPAPRIVLPPRRTVAINAPAEVVADPSNQLNLELSNGGRVVVQLRPDAAPQMVARVKTLAAQGFYNGLTFHRVIPGFMAQGGDPKGDGTGGSPLPDVPAEFNSIPHLRGSVAAARADDPNSANSQFYIMFGPRASLDGKYTVFGRVIQGMSFVDQIAPGEPPETPTRIVRASIGASVSPEAPAPSRPGTDDQVQPAPTPPGR
ncbi:peptidylprolyl isomerase [Sphingomonas sp. BN140010]|uniref:Peptidyl-prolyl cis-trans isomerase n=1 Tax=Sphingomonas arvum TaxID=2992113 RepID=A0ABT3JDD8_9SPHN|nr:peptidylprolyl isomerase [Sphingomonas sp. BN140010]MCW3797091.1 peptidylprolyl isomerase [Sphingomonas sp. BN140010]